MLPPLRVLRSPLLVSYEAALAFMACYVAKMQEDPSCDHILWLLEHEHVYTAGSSFSPRSVSLENSVELYKTDRGGQCTYHGPGQKIVYLILNLKQLYAQPDVRTFVNDLIRWIISSFSILGFKTFRNLDDVGVWADAYGEKKKVVSLGLKLRKWITYHGIAINVTTDMKKFEKIMPCGLHHSQLTSFEQLGATFSNNDLENVLLTEFNKIFPYKLMDGGEF